jgi:hypothetical protein
MMLAVAPLLLLLAAICWYELRWQQRKWREIEFCARLMEAIRR